MIEKQKMMGCPIAAKSPVRLVQRGFVPDLQRKAGTEVDEYYCC